MIFYDTKDTPLRQGVSVHSKTEEAGHRGTPALGKHLFLLGLGDYHLI